MSEQNEPIFHKVTFRLSNDVYKQLDKISKNRDESLSNVIREYISKGLAKDYVEGSKDIISTIVREEMKAVLKPSVERLAKLESKSGHIAATAAFLNVQALMDLVPAERQKEVRIMFSKARVMAVNYMKKTTEEWEKEFMNVE